MSRAPRPATVRPERPHALNPPHTRTRRSSSDYPQRSHDGGASADTGDSLLASSSPRGARSRPYARRLCHSALQWSRVTQDTTVIPENGTSANAGAYRPAGLTVLYHPQLARIGSSARFLYLADGRDYEVTRGAPAFRRPGEPRGRPLGISQVSRSPLIFSAASGDGVRLRFDPTRMRLEACGRQVRTPETQWSAEEIGNGVTLVVNGTVVLLLHPVGPIPETVGPDLGLVGESPAMGELRRLIRAVAATDHPVLLSGESGVGKELVAAAIHRLSPRGAGPFRAVNLAALNPELAASELFGHERGAFSGATSAQPGLFRTADRGTLLLDELGDAPFAVQTALLRALETRTIRPVGSSRTVPVNVRLLGATDVDLALAASRGQVKSALIERVAGVTIEVPALRTRRQDIPLLLLHFLRSSLTPDAQSRLLSTDTDWDPWLPASVVEELVRYDWPRNVRELRNVATELALLSGRRPFEAPKKVRAIQMAVSSTAEAERASSAALSAQTPARARPERYTHPDAVTRERLEEALTAHGYAPSATARALGLSQQGVYRALKRHGIRTAASLGHEELARELKAVGGDLDALSHRMRISKRALKVRRKELGLA